MPLYTDRVPYLGLVNWTPEEIHAYAAELAAAHKPRRQLLLYNGRQRCAQCDTEFPCYPASWANGTLDVRPA